MTVDEEDRQNELDRRARRSCRDGQCGVCPGCLWSDGTLGDDANDSTYGLQTKGGSMHIDVPLTVLDSESKYTFRNMAGNYLSEDQLVDFHKCPWLYRKRTLGLIDDEREDNGEMFTDALKCRVLKGVDQYKQEYCIDGCATYPVLDAYTIDKIEQMSAGVAMNDEAVALLLFGKASGVIRSDYCDMPCQAWFDWVHPYRGIVDFVTCNDLTWFESDARRCGYQWRAAFRQSMLAKKIDGALVPVHVVAVELNEPYRCGVWRLSDNTLSIASAENEAAIRRLASCKVSDDWSTGFESIRELSIP